VAWGKGWAPQSQAPKALPSGEQAWPPEQPPGPTHACVAPGKQRLGLGLALSAGAAAGVVGGAALEPTSAGRALQRTIASLLSVSVGHGSGPMRSRLSAARITSYPRGAQTSPSELRQRPSEVRHVSR
jgi:hypothetical protein